MEFDSVLLLLLAFSTGLIHALDADHIMAVSAIATKKLGMKAVIRLCLNWSLGHGVVLFVVGSLILLTGLAIPVEISEYAEKVVALFLIGIGGWVLRDLYRSGAHVHFHRHAGEIHHAHWHKDEKHHATAKDPGNKPGAEALNNDQITFNKSEAHQHDHSAIIVGVVHGFAGLAPLLAIIPVSGRSVWSGVGYLLIFCIGVFISMLVFGGVLEKLFRHIQKYGAISINITRGMLGLGSVALGVAWLS